MTNDVSDAEQRWKRLSAMLLKYRSAQRDAWGGLDDLTLAQYLAGTKSPEEMQQIARQIQNLPDLREAVNLLRPIVESRGGALAPDLTSVRRVQTTATPTGEAQQADPGSIWSQTGSVWRLVETLRFSLGDGFRLLASGLDALFTQTAPGVAPTLLHDDDPAENERKSTEAIYRLPLPEVGPARSLTLRVARDDQDWRILLEVDGAETDTELHEFLASADLQVVPRDERNFNLDQVDSLQQAVREPLHLPDGRWDLFIVLPEGRKLHVPLELGPPEDAHPPRS